MQRHFQDIVPEAQVEGEVAMFTAKAEDHLLRGEPDYVLDAIDDIETKVCENYDFLTLSTPSFYVLDHAVATASTSIAKYAFL